MRSGVQVIGKVRIYLEKAKTILISKGHERDYIEIALDWIDQRSVDLGKAPGSVAYLDRPVW